jgi:hypothetical protein
MASHAVITDWVRCRNCQALTVIIWCVDGNWRRFNPGTAPGDGWWWSRHRGGMVAPGETAVAPVATYRAHRCPQPVAPTTPAGAPQPIPGPGVQLTLPLDVPSPPRPHPAPARATAGRRATR